VPLEFLLVMCAQTIPTESNDSMIHNVCTHMHRPKQTQTWCRYAVRHMYALQDKWLYTDRWNLSHDRR